MNWTTAKACCRRSDRALLLKNYSFSQWRTLQHARFVAIFRMSDFVTDITPISFVTCIGNLFCRGVDFNALDQGLKWAGAQPGSSYLSPGS